MCLIIEQYKNYEDLKKSTKETSFHHWMCSTGGLAWESRRDLRALQSCRLTGKDSYRPLLSNKKRHEQNYSPLIQNHTNYMSMSGTTQFQGTQSLHSVSTSTTSSLFNQKKFVHRDQIRASPFAHAHKQWLKFCLIIKLTSTFELFLFSRK